MSYTGVIEFELQMNSGVGTISYLILFLRAIAFSKMTKSYHVNKILEPSYIAIFPWGVYSFQ